MSFQEAARGNPGRFETRAVAAQSNQASSEQSTRPSTNEGLEELRRSSSVPRPVRFREAEGRGLLVRAWVNERGPYTFAVDTGAGATILSPRVAAEARVRVDAGRALEIGGLSGASRRAGRKASVRSLSIGERENFLPARGLFIVADALPEDLDGILDPTEAFWPLGYVVDFPRGELSVFDPRMNPLRGNASAATDETVVEWLSDGTSRRPFVMLAGGRRALLDTGSSFGLALTESSARSIGVRLENPRPRRSVRDLGGGRVAAHRISPATVQLGSLALRRVPTDLLSGAEEGAPILLGRDALRPFQLTFDPASRLIRIQAR
ncbi:MAG TPA: aspartyl protease family protein [Pyrinomonadaceae bacterium]